MKTISDLLARDLSRKIEEIIQVENRYDHLTDFDESFNPTRGVKLSIVGLGLFNCYGQLRGQWSVRTHASAVAPDITGLGSCARPLASLSFSRKGAKHAKKDGQDRKRSLQDPC